MITLPMIYDLAGVMSAAVALQSALDKANRRRFCSGRFWGLYAINFLAGSYLPDFTNGLLVLGMVALAAAGLGRGAPATADQPQLRDRHAVRILRHAGDADGGEFQHRASGTAGTAGSQRGDPRSGADRDNPADREHHSYVQSGV
jgi:hypothetical protein